MKKKKRLYFRTPALPRCEIDYFFYAHLKYSFKKGRLMILESIKEGFNRANQNLQLVLIRITVTIINLVSFFIFLAVPLIIAVLYMGFDLAHAGELLPYLVGNPFEFISRYIGLILLIGFSFLLYLTFVTMLFLYVLGGTLGVLRSSAENIGYKFSLSSFFMEAKQNFGRLFRLIFLVSLGCTALFIALVVFGGIFVVIVQVMTAGRGVMEVFFNSFVMVSITSFSIIYILACLVFSAYSMVISVTDGTDSMDCIKSTFDFLTQKPGAFLFFFILLIGGGGVNFLFFILKMPFSMVPVFGQMMNIVLTLFSAVFQGYIAIVIWSSLMAYYLKITDRPINSAVYEI
ncbi:MAG: hypothetical protein ABFR82_12130 [Nitrospirota bacterium]